MLQEIILSVIVSFDIFLAASAYRSCGIKIPVTSAVVINGMGAFFLGISLFFSRLMSMIISPKICGILGFAILTAMGVVTIFKSLVRNLVRRLSQRGELSFSTGNSGIVVKLYLDDTAADSDSSKVLSPKEATALAVAASLDSISIGLGVGYDINPVISAFFAFLAGSLAIFLGSLAGRKISSLDRDLSWIGGVSLIIFGIFEFIK